MVFSLEDVRQPKAARLGQRRPVENARGVPGEQDGAERQTQLVDQSGGGDVGE
jgi:hypothetical protein